MGSRGQLLLEGEDGKVGSHKGNVKDAMGVGESYFDWVKGWTGSD